MLWTARSCSASRKIRSFRPLAPRRERQARKTSSTVAQSSSVIRVSMVGSSQTDPPSVTDPRTWESTHRILSPIRPHGLRGAGRDRDLARSKARRAGERPPAGAGASDDLPRAAPQRRHAQRRPGVPGHDRAMARRSIRPSAEAGEAGEQRGAAVLCTGSAGWDGCRPERGGGSRTVTWKGRRHGRRQDRRWATAWGPERTARRLRLDFPGDETMRISHEAIYHALYVRVWRTRRISLVAAEALTSKRSAACRAELPVSTARTIRRRRSWDNGAVIVSLTAHAPVTQESNRPSPCNSKMLQGCMAPVSAAFL